jgi:hypothetical protein
MFGGETNLSAGKFNQPSPSSITIYQLRVVLCGVSPLAWRRLPFSG